MRTLRPPTSATTSGPGSSTVDQEQDNLRGALEWAVANDDAETALTIAGGASWPHWLAGTSVEAKRWLDDAFRCKGEASEQARALALTGRGLIDFQLGKPEGVDADLSAALAIFREHNDLGAISLTHSFYAEVAAARGDIDEGRRRRLELLDHYLGAARQHVRDRSAARTRGQSSPAWTAISNSPSATTARPPTPSPRSTGR